MKEWNKLLWIPVGRNFIFNGDVADADMKWEKIYLLTMPAFLQVLQRKGNGNETPFNLFDGSKESKYLNFQSV